MLERLLNNRSEWNALKEAHEEKVAALEEARKARQEEAEKAAAAAKQGGCPRPHGGLEWSTAPYVSSFLPFPPFLPSCSSVPVEDVRCELETPPRDRSSSTRPRLFCPACGVCSSAAFLLSASFLP